MEGGREAQRKLFPSSQGVKSVVTSSQEMSTNLQIHLQRQKM